MELGMDNYIDVEDHRLELITKDIIELHCVSQQGVVEESLSEEQDEVTAKQQSADTIREMLKICTITLYIEKSLCPLHIYLMMVSHFQPIF